MINECIKMSESELGFFGFINENETLMTAHLWSNKAMENCAIDNKPVEFSLGNAGIWAEAIREHRPIIVNDYEKPDSRKKGCPEGHVPISRLMSIPIVNGGQAVAIAAVANKKQDYHESDILHLSAFLQGVWGILQRKRAEEALRKGEEKYRNLVENINDVIVTLDVMGTVTYISPVVEKLVGYPPSEVIGKELTEFIHVDDRVAFAEKFIELTKSDSIQRREYRLIDKSGNMHWIRTSGRPIVQGGKTLGVQGVFTDITHFKRLEERLRHAQKMEAIGTLTGGIAHDYNNLLAVIMGNLSMAQEEIDPHSVMGELLHEIEQASLKARDLTHQFLTLSQGGHPRKERGSIGSLLKEIQGQAQAHEASTAFSIQDDLRPVEFDSRQMHYAISNVLTNAVEAMPQGGTITIQAENKIIENKDKDSASPLKEGKYVKISIKDEGSGIPEKHLNRIFDPYFSTKEQGVQKGMGLGLATAYAIVEKHGGHIMVNSTTGVGTTVSIYLPATAAESDVQRAERPELGPQSTINNQKSSIQRVLVMDDEESLRTLAQRMLELLGYKVETVKDGVEAIETYKKHMDSGEPFDGVILDLTIKGGMGGAQAIKELIKIDPDVKAIVCSGYFNDPVLTNYEEHGFRGAMAKPYQKADLEQVLKKVLG